MFKIAKLTDYAMLIVGQMAKESSSVLSAPVLAETLHLSLPTVSKILKILLDKQLLSSVRGAEGGYRLNRPAKNIMVGEVIKAMEGEFAMTECCESMPLCAIESMCQMRENWLKINKMIGHFLSQISIVEMLKPLPLSANWCEKAGEMYAE